MEEIGDSVCPQNAREHETTGHYAVVVDTSDRQTDKQPPTTQADDEPFSGGFSGLATGGHYTARKREEGGVRIFGGREESHNVERSKPG